MKKPNILFILSDDQGAWALRCAGNTDILTPNLDRLASEVNYSRNELINILLEHGVKNVEIE